jgi:uncharacterized membrane protein YeiH
MQYCLEQIGVVIAALSGVLAARGKGIDMIGVTTLAIATGLGGGTLRDVVLTTPGVFWVHDSVFLITAVMTAVVAFPIARYWAIPEKAFMIADAFVLALFTISGAAKSLACSSGDVNAVMLGVTTGVAGGIIRDMLLGSIPIVFRKAVGLYASAALVGAVVFVVLERFVPGQPSNRLVGIATVLALRLAAIQWRISLPEFDA